MKNLLQFCFIYYKIEKVTDQIVLKARDVDETRSRNRFVKVAVSDRTSNMRRRAEVAEID